MKDEHLYIPYGLIIEKQWWEGCGPKQKPQLIIGGLISLGLTVFYFSADTYNNRTCSRNIRYFCYSSTDYKAGQDKSFNDRLHRADDPKKQGAAEFSLQV